MSGAGANTHICPSNPLSEGPLQLPYQRPHPKCRTFLSPAVEKVIEDIFPRMKDRDLAQIFLNAFPNTLDTTVRWHVDGIDTFAPRSKLVHDQDRWQGAQSFIVTGDINAEWLRDSTNQLAQYQSLANTAPEISNLILGAINTQAEYVMDTPYCNAFQAPGPSKIKPVRSGQPDNVHPAFEPTLVFECKYELDSLANFLSLGNQYHASTGSIAYLTKTWFNALKNVQMVLREQSAPTFNPQDGSYQGNQYTFRRQTWTGTETLNLEGVGNPLASGTGLIRSAFRPSDDATIFGYFIPANAMMSVELERTANVLAKSAGRSSVQSETELLDLASSLRSQASSIKKGIYEHAVVTHPVFGKVFAFEVDGYGSQLMMDDANIPSLLALPLLGFVDAKDEIYQNTRRMILSQKGNPYFLKGSGFSGIGGPHIGLRNAWPMSALVQAMTSSDPAEIMNCVDRVKNVTLMGVVNESVDVERGGKGTGAYTRSWFAWANSVFAQTILHLAETNPGLVLNDSSQRYELGVGFVPLHI